MNDIPSHTEISPVCYKISRWRCLSRSCIGDTLCSIILLSRFKGHGTDRNDNLFRRAYSLKRTTEGHKGSMRYNESAASWRGGWDQGDPAHTGYPSVTYWHLRSGYQLRLRDPHVTRYVEEFVIPREKPNLQRNEQSRCNCLDHANPRDHVDIRKHICAHAVSSVSSPCVRHRSRAGRQGYNGSLMDSPAASASCVRSMLTAFRFRADTLVATGAAVLLGKSARFCHGFFRDSANRHAAMLSNSEA
jgi:hypothetical protein